MCTACFLSFTVLSTQWYPVAWITPPGCEMRRKKGQIAQNRQDTFFSQALCKRHSVIYSTGHFWIPRWKWEGVKQIGFRVRCLGLGPQLLHLLSVKQVTQYITFLNCTVLSHEMEIVENLQLVLCSINTDSVLTRAN